MPEQPPQSPGGNPMLEDDDDEQKALAETKEREAAEKAEKDAIQLPPLDGNGSAE